METLLSNQRRATATFRAEGGREYLVAPVRMIVPGVLPGSKGPLFYPHSEINRNVTSWHGVPLTLGHPVVAGENVSASHPGVLDGVGLGEVRNPRGGKSLDAEAWFDVEKVRKVAPDILARLGRGERIELSTGLFTENDVASVGSSFAGRPYTHVARNYIPDHLAILPGGRGACSLADGCGVLVNRRGVRPSVTAVLNRLVTNLSRS